MSKAGGTRSRSVSESLSAVLQGSFLDSCAYKVVFMFLYAAFGATLVYLPLYFKYVGLNAAQVGVLTAVRPFIQVIGAPAAGFLADKFKKRKLIMAIALSAFVLKHLGILVAHTPNKSCLIIANNGSHIPRPIATNQINLTRGIVNSKRGNLRQTWLYSDFDFTRTTRKDNYGDMGIRLETTPRPMYGEKSRRNEKYEPKEQEQEGLKIFPARTAQEQDKAMLVKEKRQIHRHHAMNNSNHTISKIVVNQAAINRDFLFFLLIIVICELVASSMLSLLDGAVVEFLGEERNEYGRFRLWGSLGICIASLIIGAVVQQNSFVFCNMEFKDYRISFYFLFGFSLLGLLALVNTKHKYSEDIRKMGSDISKLKEIFSGVKNISFWWVFISMGVMDGFQMDFGPWFLDDLGTSPSMVGVATSLHFVVNAFTYMFSNHLINKFGYMNTLNLGLCMYAVVFIGFSFARVSWVAMVLYVLVGFVASLSWSSGISYIAMVATPVGIVSTAEGFVHGIYTGIGISFGTLIGGVIIKVIDIHTAFRVDAALAISVAVIFNFLLWVEGRTKEKEETAYQPLEGESEDE